MNTVFVRRWGLVCLGLGAVVLLMVLTPRVAANSSGVLDACVNSGNGMMRLVNSRSSGCVGGRSAICLGLHAGEFSQCSRYSERQPLCLQRRLDYCQRGCKHPGQEWK